MIAELYVFAAAAVFGMGVHGLLIARHLMRKLLSVNLMLSAVFLLLLLFSSPIDGRPDPIPQALVLTGIVIAVSSTAFALALMVRLFRQSGRATLPRFEPDDD